MVSIMAMAAAGKAPNDTGAKKVPAKPLMVQQKIMMIIGVFFILLFLAFLSVGVLINSQLKGVSHVVVPISTAAPLISARVVAQAPLIYQNASSILPYALVGYNATNASYVSLSTVYYQTPPPVNVYVLNWSNECISCGTSVPDVVSSLQANLTTYSILNNTNKLHVISPSNVSSLPAGSVLVVLNGLLPDFFLKPVSGTGKNPVTLLQSLLNNGDTIIYVGRDFSRLVSTQSVIIPNTNDTGVLVTSPISQSGSSGTFYFSNSQRTFVFAQNTSSSYGPIVYENTNPGTLLAFSNYLNSWSKPSQAGADIAQAIYLAFWVPKVAQGNIGIFPRTFSSSSGEYGIKMTPQSYSQSSLSYLNSLSGQIIITATNQNSGKTSYKIVNFKPQLLLNGSVSMPSSIYPGQYFNATMKINVPSAQLVEPHIDIFNSNMSYITSLPPTLTKYVTPPSYSFIKEIQFLLPPGSYIMQLNGLQNQHYATTYFSIGNITIQLTSQDVNASTFNFYFTSGGTPLNNITITTWLNGENPTNGTIVNGNLRYVLPKGVPVPKGNWTFSFSALSTNFAYYTKYTPVAISINPQYVEFIVALMIVILEVTLIKAPVRDEFYVDVPSLPPPVRTNIKVGANELVGVFDKLNIYYHWHFMPLSKSEIRFAISSNIRSNNMPVTLTYSNIEIILNNLVSSGMLISADDLYAPITWLDQSKHDIEYLATFKKLRVYLVSHMHIFSDLGKSDVADIMTTLHNEKAAIVIYSKTSKFVKRLPVQDGMKTYIAFLNSDKLEEFKQNLYSSTSAQDEELKMYLSIGRVVLIDADNPEGLLT